MNTEAGLTAKEQGALERIQRWFPGAELGPPETRPELTLLQAADEVLAEDDTRSTWKAVDLAPHLAPADENDGPDLLMRADGQALLYRGRRNEIHAPYESGKTFLGLLACLEVIRGGGIAVWIDFEDSPRSIAGRLLALGASPDELLTSLRYIQPGERLDNSTALDLRLELFGSELIVVDAANEAMALAGLDPNVNKDVASWYAVLPRLAIDAGATVLVLDHVAKDPGAQRGAVGAGHKIAAIDGASYRADTVAPFGRGSSGMVRLKLTKDRPGYMRGVLGPGRDPTAAEVHFDATDPTALVVDVQPPANSGDDWKPTRLMENVSRYLEDAPEPVSMRELLVGVRGKRDSLITAIEELVRGEFVSREKGPRNALLHRSLLPFREGDR